MENERKQNYLIDGNTGVTETFYGTLEEAKEWADDSIGYTQRNVDIYDEKEHCVATREWIGISFDPDDYEEGEDADVIQFGDFGYYAPWIEW